MTGAHAIDRGAQRFGFLRDASPQIRGELRRRLAGDERFDAAIHEIAHLARVIQRFPARSRIPWRARAARARVRREARRALRRLANRSIFHKALQTLR